MRGSISGHGSTGLTDLLDRIAHFAGDWQASEMARVTRAILQIEMTIPFQSAVRAGKPWVLVAEPLDAEMCYFAHRIGQSSVVAARSIDDLIGRLFS